MFVIKAVGDIMWHFTMLHSNSKLTFVSNIRLEPVVSWYTTLSSFADVLIMTKKVLLNLFPEKALNE